MVDAVTGPLDERDGDGRTPLGPDEAAGLVPTWVRTRADLNRAEATSIAGALRRYARRPPTLETMLDDLWLRGLHEQMFAPVWRWAGTYRSTERNIGIDPRDIAAAVRDLARDAAFWFANESSLVAGARFHHRLVWIHPFANGNGRHARLATDLCLRSLGHTPFSWGADLPLPVAEVRARYLAALRAADGGDPALLEELLRPAT